MGQPFHSPEQRPVYNVFYTRPVRAAVFIVPYLFLQHSLQLLKAFDIFAFGLLQTCENVFYGFVLHLLTLHLFIFVDREVVIVGDDVLHRYKKTLLLATASSLCLKILETGNHIGNVIIGNRRTLVVERETICLHIVEPHFVGAATVGFVKD